MERRLVVPEFYLDVHLWLNPGRTWQDARDYFDCRAKREGWTGCDVIPDQMWNYYWPRRLVGIVP